MERPIRIHGELDEIVHVGDVNLAVLEWRQRRLHAKWESRGRRVGRRHVKEQHAGGDGLVEGNHKAIVYVPNRYRWQRGVLKMTGTVKIEMTGLAETGHPK